MPKTLMNIIIEAFYDLMESHYRYNCYFRMELGEKPECGACPVSLENFTVCAKEFAKREAINERRTEKNAD